MDGAGGINFSFLNIDARAPANGRVQRRICDGEYIAYSLLRRKIDNPNGGVHVNHASRKIQMQIGGAMRTTLDLPSPLVDEAVRLSHQKTKTGAIITALEAYVRSRRLSRLKHFKGRHVDLDLDLEVLRDRS